jgi:hypothetical protein
VGISANVTWSLFGALALEGRAPVTLLRKDQRLAPYVLPSAHVGLVLRLP